MTNSGGVKAIAGTNQSFVPFRNFAGAAIALLRIQSYVREGELCASRYLIPALALSRIS
jgi:hypothetical protein